MSPWTDSIKPFLLLSKFGGLLDFQSWCFSSYSCYFVIICVRFCVLFFSCFRFCLLLPCGHLLGKGWSLGSCWLCFLHFCYFPMWYPGSVVVQCTWLYRFLIFAVLLTLKHFCVDRSIGKLNNLKLTIPFFVDHHLYSEFSIKWTLIARNRS